MKFVVGRSSTLAFPLRNSGDIPLNVDIEFSEWMAMFDVSPNRVQLDAGQQVVASVTFNPLSGRSATQYQRYRIIVLCGVAISQSVNMFF